MNLLEKLLTLNYEEKVAIGLILSGKVFINNEKITSLKFKIKINDKIEIKDQTKKWVSRGAIKLLQAFERWNISVENLICLDVGASTGGFTDVMLRKGASKIYSLDVGTNQLDYSLRINQKIIVLEKTNLKTINQKMFKEKIDFLACDVSFISVKRLFDVIDKEDFLAKNNNLIILIKPQFEAQQQLVEKGGFIPEVHHKSILKDIIEYGQTKNLKFVDLVVSPIKGNVSKNIEYLAYFKYLKESEE